MTPQKSPSPKTCDQDGKTISEEWIIQNNPRALFAVCKNLKVKYASPQAEFLCLKLTNGQIAMPDTLEDIVPQYHISDVHNFLTDIQPLESRRKLVHYPDLYEGALWIEYEFYYPAENNDDSLLLVNASDITRQKEAEEENIFFKAIVSVQTDLICRFNLSGTISYVNDAFCRNFRTTKEGLIGKNIYHLLPDEKSKHLKNDLQQLSPSEPILKYVEHVPGPKQELIWISGTVTAIFNSDGNVAEVQILGKDITDLIQSHDELIRAKEKAEESDRLKTVFLNNISHEIRTPLNGILGFSQLLISSSEKSESIDRYTKLISDSAKQLLHIIDDILSFSVLETNKLDIHHTKVYLPGIITNLEKHLDETIKAKSEKPVVIKKKIPRKGPQFVKTDGIRLFQVMYKLLDNAWKFTKTGSILYGYSYDRKHEIVRFFVRDTGIGIASEKQDSIFRSFRQGEEGSSRRYGGTGLGLPIAKALLKKLGSDLKLTSKPGKGSEFYFDIHLPLKTSAPKEKIKSLKSTQKPNYTWEHKTILIVEDTYTSYIVLKEFIRPTGANVLPAHTVKDALNTFAKIPDIDLVLLDLRLPDQSGFEAAKIIKQVNPDIPIIVQTAFAKEAESNTELKKLSDGFLTKPIERQELLDMLQRMFDRSN